MTDQGEGSSSRCRLLSSRYRDEPDQKKKQKTVTEEGIIGNAEGEGSGSQSGESEENVTVEAKPIGEPLKVARNKTGIITHYKAFYFDSEEYSLDDVVLLAPSEGIKPYVTIIKDIYQDIDGRLEILGQWFYRPEEAKKRGGGNWQSRDVRELFYSFHYDTFAADSIMHKCIVHFVPLYKDLPQRKVHPGFIVQKVYDTVNERLWNLTDSDYEDDKQQEIELLVQKSLSRLGDLPNVTTQEPATGQEEHIQDKRLPRKKNSSPLNVSRSGSTGRADEYLQETPGNKSSNVSEYCAILKEYAALTGVDHRDKWMEKLLQAVKQACEHVAVKADDGNSAGEVIKDSGKSKDMNAANRSEDKVIYKPLQWPDFAVRAVYALEKVSHDLYSDFQKYNRKMRSLVFNFQKNPILAFRLLDDELQPSKILNMSPNELKEAFTIEETATEEPDDEPEFMQMTDARCSRCNEIKAGVRDIIRAGRRDRYQLECMGCGYSWYTSIDEISIMTVEPNSARTVGTTSSVTSKYQEVEKNLESLCKSDEAAG